MARFQTTLTCLIGYIGGKTLESHNWLVQARLYVIFSVIVDRCISFPKSPSLFCLKLEPSRSMD